MHYSDLLSSALNFCRVRMDGTNETLIAKIEEAPADDEHHPSLFYSELDFIRRQGRERWEPVLQAMPLADPEEVKSATTYGREY